MRRRELARLVTALALLLGPPGCATAPHPAQAPAAPPPTPSVSSPAAVQLFTEALVVVRTQYLVDLPPATLGAAALRGLPDLPPAAAIRLTRPGEGGTTITHVDAGGSPATVSVGWSPVASLGEVLRELELVLEFIAQRTTIGPEAIARAMVRGLMAVDAHGAYLDPAQAAMLVETDTVAGVGLDLTIRGEALHIASLAEGGPAARSGLHRGDRILRIDGVSASGVTLDHAILLLRGPPGTTVALTVARPEWSAPREVVLPREPRRAPTVDWKRLAPGQGYLRIPRLREASAGDARAALDALQAAGAEALVLDLRGNAGGLLIAAVEVAELFLPEANVITYTEGRTKTQNLRFSARAPRPLVDVPLLVLVDEGTAAGAEILAGALQEWRRATLVGMKTAGRASLQTIVPLPDRSALKLTTAQWFTPWGRSVDRRGLTPDIEIPPGAGTERFLGDPDRDVQLRRAMDALRDTHGPAATGLQPCVAPPGRPCVPP